jgi:mannose-6-phosphate isomerase-like protein (cupin superfamily)
VRGGPETTRLGKGTLLTVPAGVSHTLENAGGGLLVVMATGAPAQS